MLAIFLDGESKSGKTAVGRTIRQVLIDQGYTVRLLVAGSFFRQLTLLVLRLQPAGAELTGDWLEPAVRTVLAGEALYRPVEDVTALDTPEINEAVSVIAQADYVQQAASEWRVKSAQRTLDDGIDIMLFDGRNLRTKLADWSAEHGVRVALELIIFCRPEVAAARYLADEGTADPTAEQRAATTAMVTERRAMDRQRNLAAYAEPADAIQLVVGSDSVDESLAAAWQAGAKDLPRPIRFDNSEVPRGDGLRTVSDLASKAVAKLAS